MHVILFGYHNAWSDFVVLLEDVLLQNEKKLKIKKIIFNFEIIIFSMIYYDIVICVMKLFRVYNLS
jgi:hypothetical protein